MRYFAHTYTLKIAALFKYFHIFTLWKHIIFLRFTHFMWQKLFAVFISQTSIVFAFFRAFHFWFSAKFFPLFTKASTAQTQTTFSVSPFGFPNLKFRFAEIYFQQFLFSSTICAGMYAHIYMYMYIYVCMNVSKGICFCIFVIIFYSLMVPYTFCCHFDDAAVVVFVVRKL